MCATSNTRKFVINTTCLFHLLFGTQELLHGIIPVRQWLQESNGNKDELVGDNDNKNDRRVALLKKHDYLGLYNNGPRSSDNSLVKGNKHST